MAVKLLFATVFIGFVVPVKSTFLASNPESRLVSEGGQKAASVGSIVTSLANFGSQGVNEKELENMEVAVESLVTKGDDDATKLAVKQLQMFVTGTLIPNRKRSQKADQEIVEVQFQKLMSCRLDHQIKQDAAAGHQVSIAQDHKDNYMDAMAEYSSCLEVLDGKTLLRDAYCHGVDDVEKSCLCESKRSKHVGERNIDCSSRVPEGLTSSKKCCDAQFEHEKQSASCTNLKLKASYAQKQHEIIMSPLCKQYESCYDSKLKLYQDTIESVKKEEKHRGWGTVYHMQCLFDKFGKGKLAQSDTKSCKDKQHTVEGISYSTIPEKQMCQTVVSA
jgi:hypothetical protein